MVEQSYFDPALSINEAPNYYGMLYCMRALVLIYALAVCSARAQESNPDQLLNSAIDAQQRGDFQTAIRDYRRVLELRPGTVEARVNLGAALTHEGQYDAAIAEYRSALPFVQQKSPILLNIALAYYKKGDFENALTQFVAVHKAQPDDVRVAVLLSDTDLHLGDSSAALSVLTPFAARQTQNLDFDFVYGSALIRTGSRLEGIDRIERVAKAGSADAYMLAGATLLQINEFERARRDLDAALQLNDKLQGIYTLAGTARDKTGDVKEAEVAFRQALKANSNDFEANLYLGAILTKRREFDEADTYLNHALQLKPTSSMARYEFAILKSTSGKYEAAAKSLEELVKDDPDWLEPHVELASLYYRLHRPVDGAKERQIVERITADQQAKGPISR